MKNHFEQRKKEMIFLKTNNKFIFAFFIHNYDPKLELLLDMEIS